MKLSTRRMAGRLAIVTTVALIALAARSGVFVPDLLKRRIAAHGTDSIVRVIDTRSGTDRARVMVQAGPPVQSLALRDIGWYTAPLSISAHGTRLLMVNGLGEAVSVEMRTGSVGWRIDVRDRGITPRRFVRRDSSSVLVLGGARESVGVIDVFSGRLQRFASPSLALLQSGCAVSSREVLLSAVDTGSSLRYIDASGTVRRQTPLPWPEFRTADPLQRQTWLAEDARTRSCVLALVVGGGFAVLDGRGRIQVHQYVERFEVPPTRVRITMQNDGRRVLESRLLDSGIAANDIAAANGILYVAFGGRTADRGSMIDCYSLPSGTYVSTLLFPFAVRSIAASGPVLYVAGYMKGVPTISVFRPNIRRG